MAKLSRQQIKKILRRHRGSAARLAQELEVQQATVSRVLSGGGKSTRILDAARERAIELQSDGEAA